MNEMKKNKMKWLNIALAFVIIILEIMLLVKN